MVNGETYDPRCLHPMGTRILVKMDNALDGEMTKGGLFIPNAGEKDSSIPHPKTGTVIRLGPKCSQDEDAFKVNDIVWVNEYGGVPLVVPREMKNERWRVFEEDEILGRYVPSDTRRKAGKGKNKKKATSGRRRRLSTASSRGS